MARRSQARWFASPPRRCAGDLDASEVEIGANDVYGEIRSRVSRPVTIPLAVRTAFSVRAHVGVVDVWIYWEGQRLYEVGWVCEAYKGAALSDWSYGEICGREVSWGL